MATAKSLLQRRITVALIIANVCVLTLYVSGWSSGKIKTSALQNHEKSITKPFNRKNEPIELTDLKVRDKSINLNQAFNDEIDWLKNFSFKIKNKSNKAITYVQLDIDFPETKATGNIMMHQIFLGQREDFKFTLDNPPLYLQPNGSTDISLASRHDAIKRFIETRKSPIENINKIVIRVGEVMFEDGTLYTGGGLFRRNPDSNSSEKWIQIPNEQATPQSN